MANNGKLTVDITPKSAFDHFSYGVIFGGGVTLVSNFVLSAVGVVIILLLALLNAHFPNNTIVLQSILARFFDPAFFDIVFWGQLVLVMWLSERQRDKDLKWYWSGLSSLLLLIFVVHL